MSDKSRIDYVDASINPLGWGCWGPGGTAEKPNRCSYCFAHTLATRHLRDCPKCNAFEPHWHPDEMRKLWRWKKARRIFVQSMGDLFGEWQDCAEIWEVLRQARGASQHTYLFLTKNPKRMAEEVSAFSEEYGAPSADRLNQWYGTSICNQADADERIPWLLKTPASVRWLSIEPLHGPIDLTEVHKRGTLHNVPPDNADLHYDVSLNVLNADWFDGWDSGRKEAGQVSWVVVGGETGNRKGKITPKREWVEAIVDDCKAAGVPVFMKANLQDIWQDELIQQLPEVRA